MHFLWTDDYTGLSFIALAQYYVEWFLTLLAPIYKYGQKLWTVFYLYILFMNDNMHCRLSNMLFSGDLEYQRSVRLDWLNKFIHENCLSSYIVSARTGEMVCLTYVQFLLSFVCHWANKDSIFYIILIFLIIFNNLIWIIFKK